MGGGVQLRLLIGLICLCAALHSGCDRAIGPAEPNDLSTDQFQDTSQDLSPGTDLAADQSLVSHNDTDGEISAPIGWCTGTTRYEYAPLGGEKLYTFPDEFYSVSDASTLTSRRVVLDDTIAPWLKNVPSNLRGGFDRANELDGFGTPEIVDPYQILGTPPLPD